MSFFAKLKQEWVAFRRPGRLIALGCAVLVVIGLGLLFTAGNTSTCDGPCPSDPVADNGTTVSDHFWFRHRDLGRHGSITVRLTSMSGTITYPPPLHQYFVAGLVPWAKTGIIIKDGTRRGSRYAALMMTGSHGVRFQYDYDKDVAGTRGGVSRERPRWLRLTRAGDTITGAESPDGKRWHTVASATLDGLPATMQIGLFSASPGDLTLHGVGLGGAVEEVRTTDTIGVFDHVTVDGKSGGGWHSEPVGDANHTELEDIHPSGAVVKDGTVTVTGLGDIGPVPEEGGGFFVTMVLLGLVIALIIVLVVAARYGAKASRRGLAAGAAVVGSAGLVTGLVAVGITLPIGMAILRSHDIPAPAMPLPLLARVVVGVAVTIGLCAVFAFGVGFRLRRGWLSVLIALSLVEVPYALAALPLLPDGVADWLLSNTPAAGFATQQAFAEYPQATEHYAPSSGYYPLPWWGGLAVLASYTLVALWAARLIERRRVRDAAAS
ncbi:MAG TPA: hypothetical protein VE172_04635 [Stackebrandtia sp.]|uniref:hypothetical protein n=1 Tax=Stackebrandtia sp. TaxID=2023065 RepID=UPI002D2A7FA0|nr:hypothetical protein [Stackebrandtia sp.]HZE38080.1 hypothetical protein [Stackebrandtia sp.]